MPQDILVDDQMELGIDAGDFLLGESTNQHQHLLLISNKGDWRQYPGSGVGISSFLKEEDEGTLLPEIKEQYEKDGMTVTQLAVVNGSIEVEASYNE